MIIMEIISITLGHKDNNFYIPALFFVDDLLLLTNSLKQAKQLLGGNTDSFHQGVLWASSCEREVWALWGGREETVEKILLFSNPDQGAVEQKKKFVEEPWKEGLRKIRLTECCTARGEVEITGIRPSAVAIPSITSVKFLLKLLSAKF